MNAIKSFLSSLPGESAVEDFAERCGIKVSTLKFLAVSKKRHPGRSLARVMVMESGGALPLHMLRPSPKQNPTRQRRGKSSNR